MNRTLEFEEWLEEQKHRAKGKNRAFKKVFIGERSYPHLDGKLHFPRIPHDVSQGAWLKETVSNTEKLASHGFLPFIHENKRQRKFVEPPHDYQFSSLRGDRDQKKFPHIKSRPIMYASHRDACIFSFYSYLLQKDYEKLLINKNLTDNIIAYRSIDGKNNVDFAKEAFKEMQERDKYDCMMLDVKGFFNNLDHILLKDRWETIISGSFSNNPDHKIIFERITNYRYLNFNEAINFLKLNQRSYLIKYPGCLRLCSLADYNRYLKKTVKSNRSGRGIPQGSPISGVLANLYLLDFDSMIKNIVVNKHGGVYQRYSDDILVICPQNKANEIYKELVNILTQNKLKLGINKTEAFRFNSDGVLRNITNELEPNANTKRKDIQYLGFNFDGYNIKFRSSTLSKHLRGKRKPDYLKGAYRKTSDPKIARQMNKVRRIANTKINE